MTQTYKVFKQGGAGQAYAPLTSWGECDVVVGAEWGTREAAEMWAQAHATQEPTFILVVGPSLEPGAGDRAAIYRVSLPPQKSVVECGTDADFAAQVAGDEWVQ